MFSEQFVFDFLMIFNSNQLGTSYK